MVLQRDRLRSLAIELSAHARNHVSCEWCLDVLPVIILSVIYFTLMTSNYGNLAALRAIFRHIFIARVQKWLFLSFQ